MKTWNKPGLYWLAGMLTLFLFSSLNSPTYGSEPVDPPDSDNESHLSTVNVSPAGTHLAVGDRILFLPGVKIKESVIEAIIRTGGDVLYSKITHYLLHMAMGSVYERWGTGWLYLYMQIFVPLAYNAFYYYTQLPKLHYMAAQQWERTQTTISWRRRGRIPVYPGEGLDKSVFMDYLIQTQEATASNPWQLEITPLQSVNLHELTSPWERTLGELINTALNKGVDLLRVTVNYDGAMELSVHYREAGEWSTSEIYPVLGDSENYLMHWLESSYSLQVPEGGMYSILEVNGLSCMKERLDNNAAVCSPLSGLQPSQISDSSFRIATGDSASPSYLHIANNESFIIGEPGSISITQSEDNIDNRSLSRQYRMSRVMARIGEYIINMALRWAMDATFGAGVEYVYNRLRGLPQYEPVEILEGPHINSKVQRVRDANGKVWIRKEAPCTGFTSLLSAQYGAMGNEVMTLSKIKHRNIIKMKEHWLEDAGTANARMVTIVEAGEKDLVSYRRLTDDEFRDMTRQAMKGVKAVHDAGFVHADIKAENFVQMADGTVKLIDFGAAAKLDENGKAFFGLRSLFQTAPETYKGEEDSRTKPQDIWAMGIASLQLADKGGLLRPGPESAGVFQYFMPNHFIASPADAQQELVDDIAGGGWFQRIPGLSSFLQGMLRMDPEERMTADELLEHPFLNP